MLLGNAISGIAIGANHCLTQVVYSPDSIGILTYSSNSAQIELFLSFGANRWEVGRRLFIKPGLRLAMLPTISQMRHYTVLSRLIVVLLDWFLFQG